MYEFGADAYLVFFGTLEIYADNFVPSERYELSVKTRYLRDKLLLSTSKLQKIFKKISQNPDKESQWEINFNNDQVIIFIPKFKKLLDNYTSDNLQGTSKKLPSDKEETFQAIRIKNKDKRIKNKESRGIFQIPSLQEISDYCQQRNNKINAQLFLDHYTTNGWMVGKNKMKDWKAAIRTWEVRENANTNPGFKSDTHRRNYHDRPSSLDADAAAEAERITAEFYKNKAAVHNTD